jgi:hypothetical protein
MDEGIPEGTSSEKDRLHSRNEISEKKKTCFAPDGDSVINQFTEDAVFTSRHACFRKSGEYSNKPLSDTLETCSSPLKDLFSVRLHVWSRVPLSKDNRTKIFTPGSKARESKRTTRKRP